MKWSNVPLLEMRKTCLLILIALTAVSCDLLFNKDSGSTPANNDIAVSINVPEDSLLSVQQGDSTSVDVTVKNIGNLALNKDIEITLTDQTEGEQAEDEAEVIGIRTVAKGLAPGDSVILNYSWETGSDEIGEHIIVATHNLEDDDTANNSSTSVLMITDPDITDLSVSSINLPEMINEGENIDVGVMIENRGNQDVSEEVSVTLTDDTDDAEIGTQTISAGIAAGDSATLEFSWNTDGASVGEHSLTAVQGLDDGNTANDSRTETVNVGKALVAEITVTALDVPEQVTAGDEVNVSVTLENIGSNDTEGDFTFTLTDQTGEKEIAKQTVDGIAAGSKAVLKFEWDTDGASIGEHTLVAAHNFEDENPDNDSRTAKVNINVAPVADVAVSEVSVDSLANQGDKVDVTVKLANQGNQNVSEPLEVTLTDQEDEKTIGTKTISADKLQSGDTATLNFTWDTKDASIGAHTLVAEHNLDDDENSNDSADAPIFIDEPPFIDLEIKSVSASSSSAFQGDEVKVSVRLRNRGNRDIDGDFKVRLNDEKDGERIGTRTVSGGLEEGAEKTVNFSWKTDENTSTGDHKLTASHDLKDDKNNNNSGSATVRIDEPPFLDVAILRINDVPESVRQGTPVPVEIRVRNRGNQRLDKPLKVTLRDQKDGTNIDTKTISPDDLRPGNTEKLNFTWNTNENTSLGEHTLAATHDLDDDNSGNNSSTVKIDIREAPVTDIAITEIDAPSSANRGDKVDVTVKLTNQGNQNLNDPLQVTLRDQTDGSVIGTKTVNPNKLPPGKTEKVKITWDTGNASIGEHTLTASHNLNDDRAGNNSRSTEVTINIPPFFDIAVTEVNAPGNAVSGQVVEIEVNLRNQGNRNVDEDFTVTLVNRTSDTEIDTKTVEGGLQEGESTSLTFQWNTSGLVQGFYTITATSNYEDDNEDNNTESDRIFIFN